MTYVVFVLLVLVSVPVLSVGIFLAHQKWHFAQTRGDNFFSRSLEERRNFKKKISRLSKFFYPLAIVVSKITRFSLLPAFSFKAPDGEVFYGPKAMASKDSFQRCLDYQPTKNDIFIATQMKCGTTWMQQIVFQLLFHGKGEFSDGGYRHMYALSPWIEMDPNGSVPLEQAPYVSQYHKKIIKTHMPAALCPINEKAKYIYVARHPASCFASTVDFLKMLTGPLCPSKKNLLRFFNSDRMWWGSWVNHVQGWWQASGKQGNILFVCFEDLKSNTPEVVKRIADFLDLDLDEKEIQAVLQRSDFSYMKANNEYFEMAAPNIFSQAKGKGFFVKGNNQRHEDLTTDEKQSIIDYCRANIEDKQAGWLDYYPELKN